LVFCDGATIFSSQLAQRLQDSSHIQAKIDVHSLFAHDTRRVDYGPPDQPAHWATLSRQIVGLRGCVLRIEEDRDAHAGPGYHLSRIFWCIRVDHVDASHLLQLSNFWRQLHELVDAAGSEEPHVEDQDGRTAAIRHSVCLAARILKL